MKKLFLIALLLLTTACTPTGESNFVSPNAPPPRSQDYSAEISSVPFMHPEAIQHHIYMREKVDDLVMALEMRENGASTEEVYRCVMGDDYARYLVGEGDVAMFQPDRYATALMGAMVKGVDSEALQFYMDKIGCRTVVNEILISSYIVFTEERPDELPLNGIDWGGVGTVDVIGLGFGGAVGASIASTGAIVGYLIREW